MVLQRVPSTSKAPVAHSRSLITHSLLAFPGSLSLSSCTVILPFWDHLPSMWTTCTLILVLAYIYIFQGLVEGREDQTMTGNKMWCLGLWHRGDSPSSFQPYCWPLKDSGTMAYTYQGSSCGCRSLSTLGGAWLLTFLLPMLVGRRHFILVLLSH